MSHISALQSLLGADAHLITDPDITTSYSRDQAPFAQSAPPLAVLLRDLGAVVGEVSPEAAAASAPSLSIVVEDKRQPGASDA